MSDKETLGIYDAKALDYAKLTQDDAKNLDLAAFIDAMPQGGRVLDLGCGPGQHAAQMARRGLITDAVDASGEMVKLAAQQRGVNARQETFDDLVAEQAYDGIYANFSLLHAERSKVPTHIAAIARALKTGGIFHIGMKTGSGEERDGIGRRYSYFSEAELENMMNDNGLTVRRRNHGQDVGLSGEMAEWVILQSKKD